MPISTIYLSQKPTRALSEATDKLVTINSLGEIILLEKNIFDLEQDLSVMESSKSTHESTPNAHHDPVSIVEGNGLSINVQGLSLDLATLTTSGAMSAADKTNLDGVQSLLSDKLDSSLFTTHESTPNAHHDPVSIVEGNGLSINVQGLSLDLATPTTSGAMSALDKTDLDNLIVNDHTHANKAQLDVINQDLATTSTPTFSHVNAGVNIVTITANYTVLTTDLNVLIVANNGAANITITMPTGVTKFQVAILRLGTGTVTIAPPAGETIIEVSGLNKVKQNGGVTLLKVSATQWWLQGATV